MKRLAGATAPVEVAGMTGDNSRVASATSESGRLANARHSAIKQIRACSTHYSTGGLFARFAGALTHELWGESISGGRKGYTNWGIRKMRYL